ncbi:MAG: hypothetical protein Q8L57_03320 [bacterium]|nr:hypothetical protein [bacterium]
MRSIIARTTVRIYRKIEALLKPRFKTAKAIWTNEFVQPVKSVKISYLPPLMVYFAAGVSGLTGVVESFFVTKVLGLEANFLAVLLYWAGIWWAFKMPIGHLVDLLWRFKAGFVALGAAMMVVSFGIMIGLTGYLEVMTKYMSAEWWYIIAALMTPFAYILQDVVADAMTVEAVPRFNADGTPVDETTLKSEHTTMQLLGRAAILFGILVTAGAAGWFARIPAAQTGFILTRILLAAGLVFLLYKAVKLFIAAKIGRKLVNGIKTKKEIAIFLAVLIVFGALGKMAYLFGADFFAGKFSAGGWLANIKPYEMIYCLALIIPAVSITGVIIAAVFQKKRKKALLKQGFSPEQAMIMIGSGAEEKTKVNWWIIGGSIALLIILIPLGLLSLTFKRGFEIIPLSGFVVSGGLNIKDLPLGLSAWLPAHADAVLFLSSLAVIVWLIAKITRELEKNSRRILIGTAIVIFVYRCTPSIGAGMNFFNIEALRFTEDFMGTLGQIGAIVGLFGLFFLRPMMAKKSLTYIFVFLTFLYSFFLLPTLGLVYGMHKWLAAIFGSDPYQMARTIALIDTVAVSPFGQLAMVPMLAWIAKEAPAKYKATYFALMASFSNLALSAGTLGTKYLNEIFVIVKPVYDKSDVLIKPGIYDQLGPIVITVGLISLVAPLTAILLFTNLRGKEAIGFRMADWLRGAISFILRLPVKGVKFFAAFAVKKN